MRASEAPVVLPFGKGVVLTPVLNQDVWILVNFGWLSAL